VKYAWIKGHRDLYPVMVMCHVLKVARSGYYSSVDRKSSPRALRRLKEALEAIPGFNE
jgi:hypothetical protein